MLQERRKLLKQKQKEKKARLVVRNLPFSTTEENLREYYENFGEVVGVDLLRKPDGKLVGCAFIQFKLVQNAAKARHHTNGKEFIGRTIECDFAMAKRRYEEKLITDTEIKKENEVKTEIKQEVDIKEEPIDNYESSSNILNQPVEVKTEEIKTENETHANEQNQISMEESTNAEEPQENVQSEEDEESKPPDGVEDQDQDEEMETDEEETQMDEEEEEEKSDEDVSETESKADNDRFSEAGSISSTKPRVSNDLVEGKTVFIKNVPFDATNDDLRQCMLQFGPVYYALICIDKLTEHSKGTAFVKFRVKYFDRILGEL